jgi:hypothetical protein
MLSRLAITLWIDRLRGLGGCSLRELRMPRRTQF